MLTRSLHPRSPAFCLALAAPALDSVSHPLIACDSFSFVEHDTLGLPVCVLGSLRINSGSLYIVHEIEFVCVEKNTEVQARGP